MRRKNPGLGTKIGGVLATPSVWVGFWAFRMYVRDETKRHILEYYRENPRVVGPVLYTLVYQRVHVGKVGEPVVRKLAKKMAKDLVPLFALNIPTQESVENYLAGKARQLLGIGL